MDLNNKTILITGGAGFIGANLAIELEKKFPTSTIIVFDIFRSNEHDPFADTNQISLGHFKNLLNFKGIVRYGDITNEDDLILLFELYKFDLIYHFAAISDTTSFKQDLIFKTNVNAYVSILMKAIHHGAKLIYASSAATYGLANHPQNIGFEAPLNAYGYSKLVMDNISKNYFEQNLINIVGLRFFNVYGNLEYYKGKTASTVLQFGLQILQKKKPNLFNGSDKIHRDFIYIKDVIQCCILAAESNKSGIYNVGTGVSRTFQDIFDILKSEFNSSLEPNYIENTYHKQYQYFTQANIDKTRSELNFDPSFSLENGICDYKDEIIKIFENEC
jgi:ADP-L-glycero-D-manno-heptose 6-epimerase